MKRKLVGLLLLSAIAMCQLSYEDIWHSDWASIVSYEQMMIWENRNIAYIADEWDYWQSPKETMERGTGDCEDFAILFMYMAMEILAIDTELLVSADHVYVIAKGRYFDPVCMGEWMQEPEYTSRYTYNEAMDMVMRYHDNMILRRCE